MLEDVGDEISSDDESLSESNEKYKAVFKNNDETVSIIDCASENSQDINYKKMFLEGAQRRKHREKVGNTAQKKQADAVNRNRTLGDGTVLPWGSIVVLKMPKDRNDFGFPNLPCMVIGINHYKKSNAIRYRLCSPDAVLQGTFGTNQIRPCPQFDALSVGINYEKIKNISMSETQAGEIYSASGGKLSYCQCKKDCLTSKTCKCRKLKKFCGAKCHGGTGNNRFCRNCLPE